MLATHRRELILDTVRSRGTVRLRDLITELEVSMATIRRDVTELAARGLVSRVHGAIKPAHSDNGRESSPGHTSTGNGLLGTSGSVAPVPAGAQRAGDGLTLGMLVPSATYYYPDVIRGARAAASHLGAQLDLAISYYHADAERSRVEELLAGVVDGIMLTVSDPFDQSRETAEWLATLPVPLVLVERQAHLGSGAEYLDSVASDHVYGACLAVRHLAGLGHSAVTLVTRRDSANRTLIEHGYHAGLSQMAIPSRPVVTTPHPEYHLAEFDEAIRGVIDDVLEKRVSALLVHNDQDAIVLAQRLRSVGVRLPDDVALVAYDDEVAEIIDTPLTAIAPQKFMVGQEAVSTLIARIAHGAGWPTRHVNILPELRIRRTCGAAPAPVTTL
jgi:DNA-binding LacI/PurR family transcriptional regulator